MTLKGCAFFFLLFLLGVALVISGFVYVVVTSENPDMDHPALGVRIVQLTGVVLAFGSIFAASGFAFYHRGKAPNHDSHDTNHSADKR